MISTIGRIPVIAAPTPRPVKPASEIGVSMTRSGPNSCTRPVRTLNAVPASATSSPSSTTRGSRRISSAMACLTASPKVSSRGAATASAGRIDILGHFVDAWIGRVDRPAHRLIHDRRQLVVQAIERCAIGQALIDEVIAENRNRIALGYPPLLFLLRPIVVAADVADVVAAEPVGVRKHERGPLAAVL